MPDVGHVSIALLGARWCGNPGRAAFWRAGAALSLLSLLPDIDLLGRALGYDGTMLGHRGLTHSLAFAAAVGLLALWRKGRRWGLCVFLVVASHGALDMLDIGPNGVAYFWPFSNEFRFWPNVMRFLPGPPPDENYASAAGAYRIAVGTLYFVPVFWLALRRLAPARPGPFGPGTAARLRKAL